MSFVEADYGASEGAALVEVLLVGLTNAKLVCKSTVEEDEGKQSWLLMALQQLPESSIQTLQQHLILPEKLHTK